MKNILRILVLMLFILAVTKISFTREYIFGNFKSTESIKSTAAGCGAPSGFRFLQVNNVRARINTGGDMWWDLPGGIGAQYFIPANGSATSLFSGSLWIGGLDINNQLKLAALRYRTGPDNSGAGQDYWTGPLTIDGTAAIDSETCAEWDKFFVVTRAEVEEFLGWYYSTNKEEEYPGYSIPQSILEYPAHGDIDKGQSYYQAPFMDIDGDGAYDPTQGDYPYYDLENELCPLNFAGDPDYIPAPTMESELYENYFGGILVDQVLKGDETFWWVFNDKGNAHTETEGAPIGMEIRAQAFGFATNDEINNMTFYSYEIINRSTYELTNTYFSPWVDTDLGYAWDDYVGCDVGRGLGYCYNGNPIDGSGEVEAYGDQPPAIGIDFFQGPYMDPDNSDNPSFEGDSILGPSFGGSCAIVSSNGAEINMEYFEYDVNGDLVKVTDGFIVRAEAINGINFGNGIVDDERYGMRRFVFHNNAGGVTGDPSLAPEYYNYLQGIWKDNTTMLYGGNAHINSGALGPECEFMFPGDSDPCNWGTRGTPPNGGYNQDGLYWTEENVGNNPSDRRFMQSAGPFTLLPGAVNYITVGIPWAKAISGGPWASVELLRVVDDKCQALFDNCFKIIEGPDAPDLTFRELDNQFIVYITNSKTSNNYKESYAEIDPTIKAVSDEYDPYFRFEGYQVFQLKDATVTLSDSRYDADKVRLVAQFDIKNGVAELLNYKYDEFLGANVPVLEVDGGDNGIDHSFVLTEDAFASGDRALINNKQYYYSVLAYGYNNFKDYDPNSPTGLDGQKEPYLAGRKNIQLYTAIPHKTVNGTIMNSEYGAIPQITRIEGHGNGGTLIDLSDETVEEILSKPPAKMITEIIGEDTIYKTNYGDSDYPIAYEPTYKIGYGPVNVRVIDPLNVKSAKYTLKFDTTFHWYTYGNITGDPGIGEGMDTAGFKGVDKWWLYDEGTGELFKSDTGTNVNYEQLFPELGLSITFTPQYYAGLYDVGDIVSVDNNDTIYTPVYEIVAPNNGFLTSSLEFADSSRRWLSGVTDIDVPGSPINWIRSGNYTDEANGNNDDWEAGSNKPWDPNEVYENLVQRTWAPFGLAAFEQQDPSGSAPVINELAKLTLNSLHDLASVDIVFTDDKSKWTRCAVVEMNSDPALAEGHADKFEFRHAPSLDKDGNPSNWPADSTISDDPNDPNYVSAFGMGWFPGYALKIETGERLNIIFGEDSWLVGHNGRDMLFNPTSTVFEFPSNNPIFGGKHYVYIMDHNQVSIEIGAATFTADFPAYDACQKIRDVMYYDTLEQVLPIVRSALYGSALYVGMPLSVPDEPWLSNDAKVKIRVVVPYERYFAKEAVDPDYEEQNKHYPAFQFSTEAIATTQYNAEKAKSDLDLISVVPNPYYAYSSYENNALDNRIKVTNLPEKCAVTIYNVNGTKIRQYTKDDPVTFIDWDLKNHAGIPIAGGVYLIHVKDETTGDERIIKWFGSLRVEDFNQF